MINKNLSALNHQSFTDLVEEYILAPEEKESVIVHAQKIFLWSKVSKLIGLGYKSQQIEKILKEYDLNKIFTQEKRKELLETANQNKLQKLWHDEQRKKRIDDENKRLKELADKCDAKYFFSVMNKFSNGKLIRNSHTIPYIKALCFFFGRDKRFETELGFDFNKGLWIRGKAGVGKTFLLSGISENEIVPFKVTSMIHIAQKIKQDGEYFIPGKLIVLDDVGSEEATVNHFGTKINWFKDFIELQYAEKRSFSHLIITTNCSFDEIGKKYGFRVSSRIKDMMNMIDVTGEDLRGKL